MSTPIVDAHIHLFPASHLDTLAWYTSPSNPLGSRHSVAEYRGSVVSSSETNNSTTKTRTHLRGFIFLETDRKSGLEPNEWTHPLDEVSFLARIASGKPIAGEGHEADDSNLCLGIIPWAPVPAGPEALSAYMRQVKARMAFSDGADYWEKIRGARYLVQDKKRGTMLGDGFIGALKWLGENGLTFDLGVDARQGGLWQLEEAVEMLRRVYQGVEKGRVVRVIINHLCKPNLRLPYDPKDPTSLTSHPDFFDWKSHIQSLSRFPHTYIKLSGMFSELPPLPPASSTPNENELITDILNRLRPWTDVVFEAFGTRRIMFASDWPVCNVGGGGMDVAWRRWREVVGLLLEERGVTEEEKAGVWGGVAVEAYGIKGI